MNKNKIAVTLETVPAWSVDKASFKITKIVGDIHVYAADKTFGAGDRINEHEAQKLVDNGGYTVTTVPFKN